MTPLEQVVVDTMGCLWEAPHFLFFSNEVEPLVVYSHLFPGIVAFIFSLVLLFKQKKDLELYLLTALSFLFSLFAIIDLRLWALLDPNQIMFLWSLLNYVEPLIYLVTSYLVLHYAFKKTVPSWVGYIFGLSYIPILIFGPTNLNLVAYDYSNCDRLAIEGPLLNYIYSLEIFLIIFTIFSTLFALRKTSDSNHSKVTFFLLLGSLLFLIALSSGNIFGTLFQESLGEESWRLGQYGLFGMPIFLGAIIYIIVKFKAFNTKLLGAQALVLTLSALVGSLLFIAQSTATRTVSAFTLLLVVVFGIFLVKSVKKEVKQREQIEELAATLDAANEKLKVLDKMKSEFVSIASHQLRSPLTSIRGYASMLAEGSYGKLTAKAQEVAERIAESSKYMALSVEDYLNVSRIEAGNMKYEYSDFSLKEVAEKIVDELRPVAIKKGLVIVFRSDCDAGCGVHADIGKVRQVIMNLIDNSMKYTPNGTITVVAHDDVKKKKMYVTIQDTGVGMSKETQSEVFEKFVRAKNANNVNVTGTGLGLFVAKKMVDDMGGKVTAESEGEGLGSAFTIEFPLL
jgi:signal transduction histidine kinase